MVMIIHGFPNEISALRFEWAWQHPDISRCLKHVPKKKPRQKVFDYCLMVLSEMLRIGPWCRLPLTVRWLAPEFAKDFAADSCPPMHMPLVYGKVVSRKVDTKLKKGADNKIDDLADTSLSLCSLCGESVKPDEKLSCISPGCLLVSHLICLANKFRKDGMILPVEGECPACRSNVLWGDLIRKKNGCYQNLGEASSESDLSDFY